MNYVVTRKPQRSLLTWDFDSILDDFFNDSFASDRKTGVNYPKVDVREEKEAFVIEAELPGMTDKDIDVKIEENLITVSSKKEGEVKEKKEGYIIRERRSSAFSRSFTLPDNVDRENIEAHYSNGLLTLTIPKTKEAAPKEIEIKTN